MKGSLHTYSEPAGLYQQGLKAQEYQQHRFVPEPVSSWQITKERTKWGQGGFKEDRGSICMSSSPDPMQGLSVVASSTSCFKDLHLCQIFRPAPKVIPKFKPPNPSVIYINASLIQLNVPCVLLVLSKNL